MKNKSNLLKFTKIVLLIIIAIVFVFIITTQLNKTEVISNGTYDGKYLSILGDSISTYIGYSSNTSVNNTLGSNVCQYTGNNLDVLSVNDTYWMQVAKETGMNLLVNNSSAGDSIAKKAISRSLQLHGNVGDYNGIKPNVVISYIGVNDIKNGTSLEAFENGYRKIISNITTNYKGTELYILTHVPYTWNNGFIIDGEEDLVKSNFYACNMLVIRYVDICH